MQTWLTLAYVLSGILIHMVLSYVNIYKHVTACQLITCDVGHPSMHFNSSSPNFSLWLMPNLIDFCLSSVSHWEANCNWLAQVRTSWLKCVSSSISYNTNITHNISITNYNLIQILPAIPVLPTISVLP